VACSGVKLTFTFTFNWHC